MIFKIIFTNQKDKIKDFIFIADSIDDAEQDLDTIFNEHLTTDLNNAEHRIVLYALSSYDNENNFDGFLNHVSNPDNAEMLKSWKVNSISAFEEDFLEFYEQRNLFNAVL